ncbi:MAG TPA: hypothetical protein VFY61_18420 [Pyrinomonadaceae bacterium]|nr:hypothetical protein [Pyrinomonadaceae bacterium]
MPHPAKLEPAKATIRAYQVGFGDCFLLTFTYPEDENKVAQERHVLIDFGSTGMPDGVTSADQMMKVANDIKQRCNDKLQIVVATHRHKDHISGFATRKDGSGTGDVIANLKPDIVIQPWTENPALEDSQLTGDSAKPVPGQGLQLNVQYVSSLHSMNSLASTIATEIKHLSSQKFMPALSRELKDQIDFLSEDNSLPNRSAVANLAGMGSKAHYVNFGYELDVSQILPGVTIHVLGPPDLDQHAKIRSQKSKDKDEFWMLQGAASDFWKLQAASGELTESLTGTSNRLFPDADVFQDFLPSHNRWFVRQLRSLRSEQLLGLVRILDRAMNNTSVILLFEFGDKKLLFPGDAQIENWEFALNDPKTAELLKDVCVYKVGHHGSRNATPKSLWGQFSLKKDEEEKKNGQKRMTTLNSTLKGKHGHTENNTEVPRTTLVQELKNLSDYRTTEEAAEANKLYIDVDIT